MPQKKGLRTLSPLHRWIGSGNRTPFWFRPGLQKGNGVKQKGALLLSVHPILCSVPAEIQILIFRLSLQEFIHLFLRRHSWNRTGFGAG